MNFKLIFSALLIVFFGGYGCEEEGIEDLIDFSEFVPVEDTTYIDLDTLSKSKVQAKNIYIEDFTGVQCNNCPDAAKRIKAIKGRHPNRVISMAIHSGPNNFVQPKADYSENYFITKDGNNIASLLGTKGFLPEGTVERFKFSSEESIITSRLNWSGQADQRILESTPLSIDIILEEIEEKTFSFLVRILYHENVDPVDAHFLAVYINENDIYDYQYNVDTAILDYKHDHVFRKSLTKYD